MFRFDEIWHTRRALPFDNGVRGAIKSYAQRLAIPAVMGILSFGAIVLVLKIGALVSAIAIGGIVLLILGFAFRIKHEYVPLFTSWLIVLGCASVVILLLSDNNHIAAGVVGVIGIAGIIFTRLNC